MFNFIKNNWKYLLFPSTFLFIIFFDTFFKIHPALTLIKLLFFSITHYMVVLKTRYVFNSDIMRYYGSLKYEYEESCKIDSLLSRRQSTIIFWTYFLGSLIMLNMMFVNSWIHNLIPFWFLVFFLIFFSDFSVEVLRYSTSAPNYSKVAIPASIKPYRRFSGFIAKFASFGSACGRSGPLVMGGFGISEVGYPMASGGFNQNGLITGYYVNNYLYSPEQLSYPINTRADVAYEFAYHGYEEDIKAGCISENPLPKRTCSIRNPGDLARLGVLKSDFFFPDYALDKTN